MATLEQIAAKAALEFYMDHGVDIAVGDEAIDRTAPPPALAGFSDQLSDQGQTPLTRAALAQNAPTSGASLAPSTPPPLGKSEARDQAAAIAKSANTLDELKSAILDFDGISLKKTATNMVFGDGNAQAKIMVIGEAPATNEDRQGIPFAGEIGALLDKIFACIGLDRTAPAPDQSIYLTNVLNWRPPGNRSPNASELEVSLPFIERHIQLIAPDIIVFCGGLAAQTLLGSGDSISRLRKKWHEYTPQTPELQGAGKAIQALVTYHPSYLLSTPTQKRNVWADMLTLDEYRKDNHRQKETAPS